MRVVSQSKDVSLDFDRFVEQLSNELEPYMNSLDYMDCEKKKYLFVRSLGRAYEANVRGKVIYHRCRDRC